jgi:hypothetical protein
VPFDVHEFYLAPDFVEFLFAFFTMMASFALLVILGKWWAN